MAGVSINGSHRIEGSFAGQRFASGTLRPRVKASYVDARKVAFFGIGPHTAAEDRVRYEFTPKTAGADLLFTPSHWFEMSYDFRLSEFEAVQLVPILHEQFVLAFRGLATITHSDGDDDVPLLLHIGGGNTVRGLQNRRYQDRNRAVLTAESWPRLGSHVRLAA